MNLKLLALPFKADEIEWRLAQCGKTPTGTIWGQCLAYIQSRAIMDRLDEVCGPENWKAAYTFIGPTGVMCQLSIKIVDTWVTKEDGAEMTDIEAFKGGISSALKRAGAVWGLGRYLYNLDSGWIKAVDKDAPGARYGKTKEGMVFHWVPPQLPAWALPLPPVDTPPPATIPGAQGRPSAIMSSSSHPIQSKIISESQRRLLFAKMNEANINEGTMKNYLKSQLRIDSIKDLNMSVFGKVLADLEGGKIG